MADQPNMRDCGDCAMCCKIPIIPELNKPYNTWCQHCVSNSSCGIYETRPQRCRDYHCHFVQSDMEEHWRPNKSRLMITTYSDRVLVMVDPARPDAWRKEPYAGAMRTWAQQHNVYVMVNKTTYAVFPDHVDDLGEVTDDHQIMTFTEQTPSGPRKRAEKVLKSELPAHMQAGGTYPVN